MPIEMPPSGPNPEDSFAGMVNASSSIKSAKELDAALGKLKETMDKYGTIIDKDTAIYKGATEAVITHGASLDKEKKIKGELESLRKLHQDKAFKADKAGAAGLVALTNAKQAELLSIQTKSFGKLAPMLGGTSAQVVQKMLPIVEVMTAMGIAVPAALGPIAWAITAFVLALQAVNGAAKMAMAGHENYTKILGQTGVATNKYASIIQHYASVNQQLAASVQGTGFGLDQLRQALDDMAASGFSASGEVAATMGGAAPMTESFFGDPAALQAAQAVMMKQTVASTLHVMRLGKAFGINAKHAGKYTAMLRTQIGQTLTDTEAVGRLTTAIGVLGMTSGVGFEGMMGVASDVGASLRFLSDSGTEAVLSTQGVAQALMQVRDNSDSAYKSSLNNSAVMLDMVKGIAAFGKGIKPETFLGFQTLAGKGGIGSMAEQMVAAYRATADPMKAAFGVVEGVRAATAGLSGADKTLAQMKILEGTGLDRKLALPLTEMMQTLTNADLGKITGLDLSTQQGQKAAAQRLEGDPTKLAALEAFGSAAQAAEDPQKAMVRYLTAIVTELTTGAIGQVARAALKPKEVIKSYANDISTIGDGLMMGAEIAMKHQRTNKFGK